MKVYIAGKITNNPDFKKQFADAELKVWNDGHIPINPAELPAGMNPADYMSICLPMLMTADEVRLLPNWQDSKGALIENALARYIGKKVVEMGRM